AFATAAAAASPPPPPSLPTLQSQRRPAMPKIVQSQSSMPTTASGTRIVTLTPPVLPSNGEINGSIRKAGEDAEVFHDHDDPDDGDESRGGLRYAFECQFCRCRVRVADREGMLSHYRLCCDSAANSGGVAVSWPGRAFECPECRLLFDSLLALNEHVRYSCEAIGQQFYALEDERLRAPAGAAAEVDDDDEDVIQHHQSESGESAAEEEAQATTDNEVCVISDSSDD
ncbi:hypothetical protein BOX15_Mlig032617g2, partial [Macrostomum lignano]